LQNLREFAHQQGLREISCAEHDIVCGKAVSLELSDVATLASAYSMILNSVRGDFGDGSILKPDRPNELQPPDADGGVF